MCKELRLIIEVDGITHNYEGAMQKDDLRQKKLESVGYTVLRFKDEDILNNISYIYDYLADWIERNRSA